MRRKIGIILWVKNNNISVVFPFSKLVKKYSKLQKRMLISKMKIKRNEFKRGDIIYWENKCSKLCF